jgi:hypothetical protein
LTLGGLLAYAGRQLPGLQRKWAAGGHPPGGRPAVLRLDAADRGIQRPVFFDFAPPGRDVKLAPLPPLQGAAQSERPATGNLRAP